MEEDRLYGEMVSEDLTIETKIRDIVTGEGLDPWNIDISILTNRFVQAVREMKQKDIKISGKFLLAAAILLKMKADYLIAKEEEEAVGEEAQLPIELLEFELEPHIPVPKKRKVTLEELMNSLRTALVVRQRREVRFKERRIEVKREIRKVDIGEKIKNLYNKISDFFQQFKTKEVEFSKLIPTRHRWDIIWTFIPLVHLANKGEVRLRQDEPFGEIYVRGREETESSD
jgi:segregation and condensation protein A